MLQHVFEKLQNKQQSLPNLLFIQEELLQLLNTFQKLKVVTDFQEL